MAPSKKPRKRAARPKKAGKAAKKERLIDHPLERIRSFAAERDAILHESPPGPEKPEPREKDKPENEIQ